MGEDVAIKLEHFKSRNPHLLLESKVYKFLAGGVGIPNVHWYGVQEGFNVMVMDLLGPSLEDLLSNSSDRKFSLNKVSMFADQMIACLEHIHSKNFIHRNIE